MSAVKIKDQHQSLEFWEHEKCSRLFVLFPPGKPVLPDDLDFLCSSCCSVSVSSSPSDLLTSCSPLLHTSLFSSRLLSQPPPGAVELQESVR